jgi:hypothetical protein
MKYNIGRKRTEMKKIKRTEKLEGIKTLDIAKKDSD